MKFRLSNGINWTMEFDACSSYEIKKRVRQTYLKYKEQMLSDSFLKSIDKGYLEIHFLNNGIWCNSNNANCPPRITSKYGLANLKLPSIKIKSTGVNNHLKSEYGLMLDYIYTLKSHISEINNICEYVQEQDKTSLRVI